MAYVLSRGGRFEEAGQAYEGEWLHHRYGRAMQIYNEKAGTTRNSLTGERLSGTPIWLPPVFADGTPIRQTYSAEEWPFLAVSTKSQLMSAGYIGTPRLQDIHPSNFIALHVDDAARLGLETGDRVRVVSPAASVEGVVAVRRGLQPGVIGIEHGYGHWGLGGQRFEVENKVFHASELRRAGVAINRLGLGDPTRTGISTLADIATGANARQGVPVRLERI